jgi:hypothetical protein
MRKRSDRHQDQPVRTFLVKYLFREEFVLKVEKRLYKFKRKGSLSQARRFMNIGTQEQITAQHPTTISRRDYRKTKRRGIHPPTV